MIIISVSKLLLCHLLSNLINPLISLLVYSKFKLHFAFFTYFGKKVFEFSSIIVYISCFILIAIFLLQLFEYLKIWKVFLYECVLSCPRRFRDIMLLLLSLLTLHRGELPNETSYSRQCLKTCFSFRSSALHPSSYLLCLLLWSGLASSCVTTHGCLQIICSIL